jgi:ubiquinone/menaquinone biosynthesis C-methylase UbiE
MTEPTVTSPAASYEAFQVRYLFGPWSLDLIERVRPQPGERVLDLACGTGAVAREVLKRISPGGTLVGVDINADMLRVASEVIEAREPLVRWQQGSAESLPLPDASFDVALCQQGLQFFPDKQGALRELRRVLKPGGRLALSVWRALEHNPVQHALSKAAAGRLSQAMTIPFGGLGENGGLERMLEDAGFQSVRVVSVEKLITQPDPDGYVERSVRGGAAVLPDLRAMTEDERAQLVAAVRAEMGPTLRSYTTDGELRCPMAVHVATARN